ncbi:hypothetical protein Cantr_01997 [Candida viswanathii]|uniref:Uncharacterized protein n=1 Tax=Candida viswanathii TaxID=5486 RepID=A0A367YKK3_9ASCO|nr:hypothetical protein Cantr_01997 [Candida viswanathii]
MRIYILVLALLILRTVDNSVIPRLRRKHKHRIKPEPSSPPTVYSLRSIEDLQVKHADKLNSTSNLFHFKDTKSSLYYSTKERSWVEIRLKNCSDTVQRFPLEYWIPASYCLDSTEGSGGTVSRSISVLMEVAMENYMDIYAGLPAFLIHEAAGVSVGVKVGKQMVTSLLFSCYVNDGEILQMRYRPSYVIVPEMMAILYKFDGKKLRKKKVKKIKPFKTLVIDAPEHQCWASTNINDLQCFAPINHKHIIKF